MKRTIFAVSVVLALLAGQSFGLIASVKRPARSQAAAQFTAAETLLSQTGTIGTWAFREPPGFPPVKCTYPAISTSSYHLISVLIPIIYPVQGVTSQSVQGNVKLYRRLPNGSLGPPKNFGGFGGTASVSPPFHQVVGIGSGFDLGSTWVAGVEIRWMDGSEVQGTVDLLYTQYQTTLSGDSGTTLPVTDACKPQRPAVATLGLSQGTVNANIPFTINRFPQDPAVTIYFDGVVIGSVATDNYGNGAGAFKVPAAPMGNHTVKFYRFGRTASDTFTIKPRIKLIPSSGLERGDTVNVSLRGFAKQETVRIRWKNGASWVQVAQVVTSNTGSANVDIHVPSFAAIGTNSVRGDGNKGGAAQTNVVNVVASSSSSSAVKATPTPTNTPIPAVTPTATATAAPATFTPPPTTTATQPLPTETSVPTETPAPTQTVEQTDEATATGSPAAP